MRLLTLIRLMYVRSSLIDEACRREINMDVVQETFLSCNREIQRNNAGKIEEPPQVEALRGFSSGVILRYVAPTGIDPVTFRFSV